MCETHEKGGDERGIVILSSYGLKVARGWPSVKSSGGKVLDFRASELSCHAMLSCHVMSGHKTKMAPRSIP